MPVDLKKAKAAWKKVKPFSLKTTGISEDTRGYAKYSRSSVDTLEDVKEWEGKFEETIKLADSSLKNKHVTKRPKVVQWIKDYKEAIKEEQETFKKAKENAKVYIGKICSKQIDDSMGQILNETDYGQKEETAVQLLRDIKKLESDLHKEVEIPGCIPQTLSIAIDGCCEVLEDVIQFTKKASELEKQFETTKKQLKMYSDGGLGAFMSQVS